MKSTCLLVVLLACLALGFARPVSADESKLPIPAAADAARAEALIKDIFKDEYAKTSAAEKVGLAKKLLEQAAGSKNEPAAQYILLREARDLAARAGAAETAMKAADLLSASFEVPSGEAHAAAAEPLVSSPARDAAAESAARALVAAGDAALTGEEYSPALAMFRAAEQLARRAKVSALALEVAGKVKQVETLSAESEKIKAALALLDKDPSHPEANLTVGKFRCFVLRNWDAGLANLALSANPKLKDAAVLDLKAQQGAAAEGVTAADAWYDLAGLADGPLKTSLQGRAHYWYTRVGGQIDGLAKVRVEKRIEELKSAATAGENKANAKNLFYATLRDAVKKNELKRWETVGGAFARETFEEIPPEGALLVGFRYTTQQGGRYPHVVQPIFLTALGKVTGKIHGQGDPKEKVETTEAKLGYAVGAIEVRGGGGFDAFRPIYMKITEKGLDPADQYSGPKIGGDGGSARTVGGDGNFIVGIHGKIDTRGRNPGGIQGLGVVTTTSNPAAKTPAEQPGPDPESESPNPKSPRPFDPNNPKKPGPPFFKPSK